MVLIVVPESGLYTIILKSRKPEARAFRKWVTSEVLPSIRKHGMYMTQEVAREAVEDPMSLLARKRASRTFVPVPGNLAFNEPSHFSRHAEAKEIR
ncbi:hypothetical protein BGV60_22285 [Burkholderia ubonensis]|nr:hypothetical protein BGV59_19885 [Burkholderia ubonensis]OJB49606.1 hypothetical protein BGV60_22285 [Burkholderia ubonensis]